MNPEEFTAFVKDVINEEVTESGPCSCCGITEIDGVQTAADRIAAFVVRMFPPSTAEKCGRCGTFYPADEIQHTGPYNTCPSCTNIVRGVKIRS